MSHKKMLKFGEIYVGEKNDINNVNIENISII